MAGDETSNAARDLQSLWTSNASRFQPSRDLIAECRLLKLGKRLAVGEVTIRSEGMDEPVAHVTSTYSIPTG